MKDFFIIVSLCLIGYYAYKMFSYVFGDEE